MKDLLMKITVFTRCRKTILLQEEFVIQVEMAAVESFRHVFNNTSTEYCEHG